MQNLHKTLGVDLREELRALSRKERGDLLKGALYPLKYLQSIA